MQSLTVFLITWPKAKMVIAQIHVRYWTSCSICKLELPTSLNLWFRLLNVWLGKSSENNLMPLFRMHQAANQNQVFPACLSIAPTIKRNLMSFFLQHLGPLTHGSPVVSCHASNLQAKDGKIRPQARGQRCIPPMLRRDARGNCYQTCSGPH